LYRMVFFDLRLHDFDEPESDDAWLDSDESNEISDISVSFHDLTMPSTSLGLMVSEVTGSPPHSPRHPVK
jgi:hypothetical protein